MNILLFLPGLLCLLFQYRGLVGTLEGVISIVAVQVCHSTSFVLTPDLAPCSHAPGTPSIPVLPLVRGPVPHPSLLRLGIRFLPTILLQVDRQLAVPLRAVLPLSDTLHESCRDARELLEPILGLVLTTRGAARFAGAVRAVQVVARSRRYCRSAQTRLAAFFVVSPRSSG